MSSPTPASATAAALAGILGHNQQQPRRMSNTFNSLPLGPGGGSNRSLTPPTQQPSPNSSFLAGLSSRLRSQGAPGAPGVNSSNINASAPNYGMRNTGPLVDIGMFDAGSTGSQFGYRSVGQNFGIPSGPSGPPTLDMNEFPSLGGPSGSNLSGGSAPGSNRPNFGGIFKDSERTEYKQQPAPIYTMDVNDFPALTATNPPMANSGLENSKHGVSGGGVDHHQTPQNQFTTGGLGLGGNHFYNNYNNDSFSHNNSGGHDTKSSQLHVMHVVSSLVSGEIGVGSSNQLSSSGSLSGGNSNSGTKTLTSSSTGEQKKGIQTHKSGRVTNIPMGMVTDQFGMTGLLTFIRAAETEPKLVSLALGTDLTSLKLDLNSSENLYSNFPGPWSDLGLKPHEIDYPVPSEYLIYHQIRDKLAPIRDKINRYGEDTLFYLYYSFPNDLLQIAAASEL